MLRQIAGRRVLAIGAVLLALLAVPAPLLPPHRLAEAIEAWLGCSWKAAYLAAAIGTQAAYYGSLGLVATLALDRAETPRGRLLQIVSAPAVVIGVSLGIRALALGHLPLAASALVAIVSCLCGVMLGLGILYRRGILTTLVIAATMSAAIWSLLAGASATLSAATRARLERLVAAGPSLPQDERRFGAVLQAVFAQPPGASGKENTVESNRAAILAWGIAIGHERLAGFVGLDPGGDLVRRASALRSGTAIHGREDWSRHYALSAALTVLEHPFVSDAAGLLKEQLDAHSGGSGFSFGDLAADRAGVRFAAAATRSEAAAVAMHRRLGRRFDLYDFFPAAQDLPENLTVEEFRRRYGTVGSDQYREAMAAIETRLDRCAALR